MQTKSSRPHFVLFRGEWIVDLVFLVALVIVILAVLLGLTGCSIVKGHYVKRDDKGILTQYDTMMLVAPFSSVADNNGKMSEHTTKTTSTISVGQQTKDLDQTGQIDALALALSSLDKALALAGAARGIPAVPIPALPGN